MNSINYGFGKEYLPKWGINEALREIYQNYIDYGNYKTIIRNRPNNMVHVTLRNDYVPNKLEFLRIGQSNKNGNQDAIGHHGEGLKMAFLIFLREDLYFNIYTNRYVLYPRFNHNDDIGDTLEIRYVHLKEVYNRPKFTTVFECDKDVFNNFISNIITKDDIIYEDSYHGSIVNKPKGNIYSGGLFVCNLPNISKAYDIKPRNLPLDRDRCLPQSWDVSYHTSKLNEKSQWKHEDTTCSDTQYIEKVSDDKAKEYKKTYIESRPVFIHKSSKEILNNNNIKNALLKNPMHSKPLSRKDIIKDKERKAKRKGILTLLRELIKKHSNNIELIEDINIIIKKLKMKL